MKENTEKRSSPSELGFIHQFIPASARPDLFEDSFWERRGSHLLLVLFDNISYSQSYRRYSCSKWKGTIWMVRYGVNPFIKWMNMRMSFRCQFWKQHIAFLILSKPTSCQHFYSCNPGPEYDLDEHALILYVLFASIHIQHF